MLQKREKRQGQPIRLFFFCKKVFKNHPYVVGVVDRLTKNNKNKFDKSA